jgi:uncharacterized protein YwgA
MRNKKQIIWDYFALLRLFQAVNRISHIDGNLKVQKLSFITEVYSLGEGLAAMHFKFFRYTHGPFSKDLANGVDHLMEAEVLTTTRRLTKKGDFILDYLTGDAQQNTVGNAALITIERVVNEFGKFSGPKLKDIVYKMTVPVHDHGGVEMKVRDIETFTDILVPSESADLGNPSNLLTESMIEDIQNEIDLPLECLDPTSREYQKTVTDALQHALTS